MHKRLADGRTFKRVWKASTQAKDVESRYQRAGVIETGFYLASINTAGTLDPVDIARFIGGRIRRTNQADPRPRRRVIVSEKMVAGLLHRKVFEDKAPQFFEIRILTSTRRDTCRHALSVFGTD